MQRATAGFVASPERAEGRRGQAFRWIGRGMVINARM